MMAISANPPDGGWGWIVVVGAHFARAFTIGLVNSCGPILVEWLQYFGSSTAKTAWVFSFSNLVQAFMAPFAATLTKKIGLRLSVMIGGGFLLSGLVLSAFAQRVEHLFLTIGILCGIGIGMTNTPSLLIVGVYFKKHFTFVNGLVVVGSSTGTLILPPLFVRLNDKYGWQGALVVFAAISANTIACGAVFRPLIMKCDHIRKVQKDRKTEESPSVITQTFQKECDDDNPLSELDVRWSPIKVVKTRYLKDISNTIASTSAISIFKRSKSLSLFLICTFSVGAGYVTPIAHLANRAVTSGLSKDQAAIIMVFTGVGTFIGRCANGWFIDRHLIQARQLMMIVILFASIEAASFILTDIFLLLILLSFLHGLHGGIATCLAFVIPRYLVRTEEIPSAIGVCNLFHILGNVVGAVIGGLLYDVTGTYLATFFSAGAMYMISALSLIPAYYVLNKTGEYVRTS